MVDNTAIINQLLQAVQTGHPVVVHTDGSLDILLPVSVPLSKLRDIVGGYIEYVPVNKGIIVYVNEHFIMLGLPINPVASLFCGQEICGNMIVIPENLESQE